MIVSNKHPAIAKEGWLYIAIYFALALIGVFLQSLLSILFLTLSLFLLYIYRDPAREIPAAPLGIISPVDGKIVSIDKVENKYTDELSYKIGIKGKQLGVFSIRSPIEGKLIKQLYETIDGKSQHINWVKTDEGDNILWDAQFKGRKNTHCYVQPGERIGHGQRCGFLAFNSYVNLYIPANSSLNTKVHESVLAGESILAYLVRNQGASIVSRSPTAINLS